MAGIKVSRRFIDGVDYGPTDYEQTVRALLEKMESKPGNPVAQVIINAINATKKDLTIYPYEVIEVNNPGAAHCNAVTGGSINEGAPATQIEAYRKAKDPLRDKAYIGDPFNPQDHIPTNVKLAGGGVKNLELLFTPGSWGKSGCFSGGPGALPDEVLLHELVHCLRKMQGVSNPVPTSNGYLNEEEYLAIVVTNVYMSVKDGPSATLRAGYGTPGDPDTYYLPLRRPLNTSYGFIRDDAGYENWKILDHYYKTWTGVFLSLAGIAAVFNPFHAIRNPQRQH